MNDRERYLFDVNGFLVVPGVIPSRELDELWSDVERAGVLQCLDDRPSLHAGFPRDYFDDAEWAGERGPRYWLESLMLDWGPAVRRLVADPRLHPYLVELVGEGYRLDHSYGVFARGRTGAHPLHSGATPFDASQWYAFSHGRMHNAMVVVQVALAPAPAGAGGFCCIPGSHKANYALPDGLADLDSDGPAPAAVTEVGLDAGDVLIFTEAVTHGSRGWRGSGDRAALLYKYCQGGMQWERSSPFVSPGHEWARWQQQAMEPPYVGGRAPVRHD